MKRLEVVGVENDGERSVVCQRDAHVRAEAARFHFLDVALRSLDERLVKALRFLGRTRPRKRRAVSSFAVGVKGELRDDEDRPATSARERLVLPSSSSKMRSEDLRPQALDPRFAVILPDAEKDEIAFSYLSDDGGVYGDGGVRYSLDDGAHGVPFVQMKVSGKTIAQRTCGTGKMIAGAACDAAANFTRRERGELT